MEGMFSLVAIVLRRAQDRTRLFILGLEMFAP
jgi:hypothetical protein